MKIVVIGAGAVGGYFGGRLAAAGEEVVFVARGRTLEALRSRGLAIESPLGDLALEDVRATDDPASLGEVDAVVVGVKAWQVPGAAEAIRPLVGRGTCVLPLQNGVEAADQLAAVLGYEHVLGAVCKIIARVVEPGQVRHFGARPAIALGALDPRAGPCVERLRRAFERARVAVETPRDVRAAIWEKFLFITAVSGVGAVTRSPVGVLRELAETRAMLEEAMGEVAAVAAARGVDLAPGTVDRAMSFVDRLPADATASMQRDVMEGRPSELESQAGAVVRLGRELGVATPVHGFVYASLLPLERKARS